MHRCDAPTCRKPYLYRVRNVTEGTTLLFCRQHSVDYLDGLRLDGDRDIMMVQKAVTTKRSGAVKKIKTSSTLYTPSKALRKIFRTKS